VELVNSSRQLILHMNNAIPHRDRESITCLKKSRIHPIDRPPCSPDLMPSDRYLFGTLKQALVGRKFAYTEELLLLIRGVTDPIGWAGFESVFDAWKQRLSECIQMKSKCIASGQSKSHGENPYSHRQTEMRRTTGQTISRGAISLYPPP
jgi:hypothetical protein